jgi:hypothetical protein
MSVNINDFRNFVLTVQNKVQSGNTITVAQFNNLCNRAQMSKFEADRSVYIQTGELTKFLTFFLKNSIQQVSPLGELPYPSDWEHTVAMRNYYVRPNGKSVEVQVVESKDKSWGEVQTSSLLEPTLRFPKYMEFANEFRFLPKSIGTIYFKTPVAPLWNYTVVNSRSVYDPLTSVDFEFEDFSTNEVAAIYLQLVGINIQMPELIKFATEFKEESKAVL